MFRLVVDVNEINIDQVKLPKIPGIGMITRLPNDQKFSMLVTVLNSRKAELLPKIEEAVTKKWGYVRITDFFAEMPADRSCYIRFRIDVSDADYDRAIDSILPGILQPSDVCAILGEDYSGSLSTPDVIRYMHEAPLASQKEYYLVKSLSTEKTNIANAVETSAASQGAILRIGNIRFLLKQS